MFNWTIELKRLLFLLDGDWNARSHERAFSLLHATYPDSMDHIDVVDRPPPALVPDVLARQAGQEAFRLVVEPKQPVEGERQKRDNRSDSSACDESCATWNQR